MLALAIVLIALATACAGVDTTVIATSADYHPYTYLDEEGKVVGFEVELGAELCRRAKLSCTWVQSDWAELIPNLQDEQFDAIMAVMTSTEERREQINFTQHYVPPDSSAYVALADADESAIHGKVAAQVNTIQADYVRESGAVLRDFRLAEDPIKAVREGRADAALAPKTLLEDFVAESNGELIYIGPEVALSGDGASIGLRKGDDELLEKFNAAIAEMKADGSLNQMIIRWLGADAETF